MYLTPNTNYVRALPTDLFLFELGIVDCSIGSDLFYDTF